MIDPAFAHGQRRLVDFSFSERVGGGQRFGVAVALFRQLEAARAGQGVKPVEYAFVAVEFEVLILVLILVMAFMRRRFVLGRQVFRFAPDVGGFAVLGVICRRQGRGDVHGRFVGHGLVLDRIGGHFEQGTPLAIRRTLHE